MPFHLRGTITVPDDSLPEVRTALEEHVRLTRAEPGCLAFDVTEGEGGVFDVCESFADVSAFEAHQDRTQRSDWAAITKGMPRDYETWSD